MFASSFRQGSQFASKNRQSVACSCFASSNLPERLFVTKVASHCLKTAWHFWGTVSFVACQMTWNDSKTRWTSAISCLSKSSECLAEFWSSCSCLWALSSHKEGASLQHRSLAASGWTSGWLTDRLLASHSAPGSALGQWKSCLKGLSLADWHHWPASRLSCWCF